MQKVVVDTNILVSALWSQRGNPYAVIELLLSEGLTLCYTDEIIEEYAEVLCREKFGFSKDNVDNLLREMIRNGIRSEHSIGTEAFTDETDRKFYDTAKANDAILITGNMKHYPECPFVMTPLEFLHIYGLRES